MKTADLLREVNARRTRFCVVPNCERAYYCKGYCSAHYRRWRLFGDAEAEKPLRIARYAPDAVCIIGGCGRRPASRGMCLHHYNHYYSRRVNPFGERRKEGK